MAIAKKQLRRILYKKKKRIQYYNVKKILKNFKFY